MAHHDELIRIHSQIASQELELRLAVDDPTASGDDLEQIQSRLRALRSEADQVVARSTQGTRRGVGASLAESMSDLLRPAPHSGWADTVVLVKSLFRRSARQ